MFPTFFILLSGQAGALSPVRDNPEPLEAPIGLGPEQGFEDCAAWESDDDELVSFMVQELEDIIWTMSMPDSMAALLRSGSGRSVGHSTQTWSAL
jgi:hypothetical protein